jgi:hemerythrin-like metal-binding protein
MNDRISIKKPDMPENAEVTQLRAHLAEETEAHRRTRELLLNTETAYGRFVPRQFLNLLNIGSIVDVKLGDQAELKMTILFSDIRNFTSLSESITPRENFDFINSYLSVMEPEIARHHGLIDKYVGDGIMGLFPRDPDDAVRGAIAMLDTLVGYNEGRKRAGYVPLQIGIGLNAGMVMIGTVGGRMRMDSTVIGDAVNLASRMEEMTKTYLTPLLLSGHTLYSLSDVSKFRIRFIDRVHAKGRHAPVSVYEVFDNDNLPLQHRKLATQDKFERALAYYHMRESQRSIPLLEECLDIVPEDYVAQIYLERCKEHLLTRRRSDPDELGRTMEWSNDFVTDIEAIDLQHQELLTALNRLTSAIKRGERDEAQNALILLEKNAGVLFELEENLMRHRGYPFIREHQVEHQRFSEHLADFQEAIGDRLDDPTLLLFRAQMSLLDWFTYHTTKTDRHMARHLHSTNSPA